MSTDRTDAVGLERMGAALSEPVSEKQRQRAIDQAMREMLKSPPYSPQFAQPSAPVERGTGWQRPLGLGATPPTPLIGALRDEWGPTRKGQGDWRQAVKWLERWQLVPSDQLRRFDAVFEPGAEDLEWLWKVVAQKIEEGEREAKERAA
jgi:hypothetical protein